MNQGSTGKAIGEAIGDPTVKTTASAMHPTLVEHLLAGYVTIGILEQHSRMPEIGVFTFFIAAVSTVGHVFLSPMVAVDSKAN